MSHDDIVNVKDEAALQKQTETKPAHFEEWKGEKVATTVATI